MKKIKYIIATIVFTMFLVACTPESSTIVKATVPQNFTVVAQSEIENLRIYTCKESHTDIMYIFIYSYNDGYNGAMSLSTSSEIMVNKEGKPLTYSEWNQN